MGISSPKSRDLWRSEENPTHLSLYKQETWSKDNRLFAKGHLGSQSSSQTSVYVSVWGEVWWEWGKKSWSPVLLLHLQV